MFSISRGMSPDQFIPPGRNRKKMVAAVTLVCDGASAYIVTLSSALSLAASRSDAIVPCASLGHRVVEQSTWLDAKQSERVSVHTVTKQLPKPPRPLKLYSLFLRTSTFCFCSIGGLCAV